MLLQAPEGWNGGLGFISEEMIQTHCPAPADDIQVHCFSLLAKNISSQCYREKMRMRPLSGSLDLCGGLLRKMSSLIFSLPLSFIGSFPSMNPLRNP